LILPPEIIEGVKRAALLPRGAVRIINGIFHIPIGTTSVIAVLGDPVPANYEA